ncbi:MAG: hypothetical protein A2Z20_09325 [Bdellovibrionales bacterium RBG_16_40_8]|nr:MAG: hypothetical protein A2Z20_09325 [Bdellovibrionales bacterium RBG_16_40_8]
MNAFTGAGVYTASVTGLTYPTKPGEIINVKVVAADTDGVTGSPLTTTVTLLPALAVAENSVIEGAGLQFVVALNVEWFNPSTGVSMSGMPTTGGTNRIFSPPFTGDAVLYLAAPSGVPATPT